MFSITPKFNHDLGVWDVSIDLEGAHFVLSTDEYNVAVHPNGWSLVRTGDVFQTFDPQGEVASYVQINTEFAYNIGIDGLWQSTPKHLVCIRRTDREVVIQSPTETIMDAIQDEPGMWRRTIISEEGVREMSPHRVVPELRTEVGEDYVAVGFDVIGRKVDGEWLWSAPPPSGLTL